MQRRASRESYNLWRGSDSTLQGKGAGEDEISLRDVHLQKEPWRPGACGLGSVGAEVRCWDVRPQHPKSVMPAVRFERSTREQQTPAVYVQTVLTASGKDKRSLPPLWGSMTHVPDRVVAESKYNYLKLKE